MAGIDVEVASEDKHMYTLPTRVAAEVRLFASLSTFSLALTQHKSAVRYNTNPYSDMRDHGSRIICG